MGSGITLINSITAGALGTGSCNYDPPPSGQCFTGTIIIANAAAGVSFAVLQGNNQVGFGQGQNPAGPIQALPTQRITVNAQGMVPGTTYTVFWNVVIGNPASVDGVYPAAVATAQLPVASVEVLFPSATVAVHAAGTVFSGIYCPVPVQTVELYLGGNAGAACAAQVTNLTSGAFSGIQSVAFGGISPLFFPVPFNAGDQLQVELWALVSSTQSIVLQVIGLGDAIQPNPLRSDGRQYPLGSFGASAEQNGAGSTALVVAPAAPGRVLLKTATICGASAGAAGNFGEIAVTVNGTSFGLTLISTDFYDSNPWGSDTGLLCDANTAVTLVVVGGGSALGSVTFDYIV